VPVGLVVGHAGAPVKGVVGHAGAPAARTFLSIFLTQSSACEPFSCAMYSAVGCSTSLPLLVLCRSGPSTPVVEMSVKSPRKAMKIAETLAPGAYSSGCSSAVGDG